VIDSIHTLPVMLAITVGVDSEDLERHLAASPRVVGAELALQVDDYANRNRLGYYPALAFFKEQGGVEPELLKAEDDIAWFLTNWAQEQVKRLLRPQFAQLRFESVQATAFTMPPARPQSRDGVKDLARHYTVDQIKILLEATIAGKQAHGDPQQAADASADKAREALQRRFPLLQLNSVALQ
jgi:hypothetical protein